MASSALAGRLGGCTHLIRSCSVGTFGDEGLTVDLLAWVSTWHHQCHCGDNYDPGGANLSIYMGELSAMCY